MYFSLTLIWDDPYICYEIEVKLGMELTMTKFLANIIGLSQREKDGLNQKMDLVEYIPKALLSGSIVECCQNKITCTSTLIIKFSCVI